MDENVKHLENNHRSAEIKVVGVGGGGGNAVNYMCRQGIRDVDFVICNTDAQAMESSPVQVRVQLGASLTEGRGAGNKPEVGKEAAIENINDVMSALSENTKMVFVTAGMGGGTGTGAAPVIAKACKEAGFLTVGIVTIPFRNEGRRRIKQAADGIAELEGYVDSLLVINNERIREMFGDFPISEAFSRADNVLATAAKGIAEIITVPGYINVDFADVETVMRKSGLAIMGTGIAEGENRAAEAVESALNSPLLNNNDIRGARNILVNITSGSIEVTMDEIGEITDIVQNKAGFDADLIWGNGKDDSLGEKLSVTIIATGFNTGIIPELNGETRSARERHFLIDNPTVEKPVAAAPQPKMENGVVPGQKYIEFDIAEEKKQEEFDFESMYPGTTKERKVTNHQPANKDFAAMSDEDVENMENVPAYLRRQLRMNDPQYKIQRSNLTVSGDNRISDKNSYLHRQVD
ncbi:MAG: cell division protein FtsZ [Draconibacterium sp.]